MDLSKLSDQDLAAISTGDMSKVSDAGLAHLSAPSAPEVTSGGRMSAAELTKLPTEIDPAQQPSARANRVAAEQAGDLIAMGHLPHAEARMQQLKQYFTGGNKPYVDLRDENIDRMKSEADQEPTAALVGKGVGLLAGGAVMPMASTIKGMAAAGGAMGALYNPGDTRGVVDPLQAGDRASGAVMGTLAGAGGGIAAATSGKLANYLMRKGTGISRMSGLSTNEQKEMGQSLLDQGVWGGRDGIREQAEKNLGGLAGKIQDKFKDMTTVPSGPVANDVAAIADKYRTASVIPDKSMPYLNDISDRFSDIARRPNVSPSEANELAIMAGRRGYSGAPGSGASNLEQEMGRAEERGYKGALTSQDPTLQPLLTAQRANILAKAGTKNAPELGPEEMSLIGLFGGPGAMATHAASKAPIVATGAAQGLSKLSQGARKLTPAALRELLSEAQEK